MADTKISALSALGDVSGTDVLPIVNANETKKATVAQITSAVEAHASAASAAATSVDARVNILSNAISVVSQQVSVLSSQVSTVSVAVTSVDTRVNTLSNAIDIVSQQISLLSQAHSVLSQAHSTLSVNVGTLSNTVSNLLSLHDVLSNRVSANSGVGGGFVASARTTGATSVQGGQSVVNALSARISQNAASIAALSNVLSGVSIRGWSSPSSATVSSKGLQSCLNRISNTFSNAFSAGSAVSAAMTSVDARVSVLSANYTSLVNRVSANSGTGGSGSVTSNELSAAVGGSARTSVGGATSVKGLQSALNALSGQISQVWSVVSNALSAGDVVSANIVSLQSTVSHMRSALSNVSATSAGGGSATGLQAVIDALSNKISTTGAGAASVTSVEHESLSAKVVSVSAQLVSIDAHVDTVSNAVSAISQQVSLLSQLHSVLSQNVSTLSINVQTVSNAASNALSIANAASNAASVVSAALVVTSNALSDLISIHNVLSNRVSANSGIGGGGSVTSNELSAAVGVSAVSAATSVRGLQNVINQLSNRTSVLSQAHSVLSNVVSNVQSAINNVSANSAVGSATGLQNVVNLLSNKISQVVAGGGITSADAAGITNSILASISCRAFSASGSANTSVKGLQSVINRLSNTFSNSHSAGSVVGADLSNLKSAVSVLSQAHSALSQAHSTLSSNHALLSQKVSAGVGVSTQYRRRTGASVGVQTTTTLSIISGLSVSCEAGGVYFIQGGVIWENATSGIIAFGVSVPALAAGGSYIRMNAKSATTQENTAPMGLVGLSAIPGGATNVVSVSAANVNTLNAMIMEAYIVTSAAGSFGILGRRGGTTATASIRGGWIRSQRLE